MAAKHVTVRRMTPSKWERLRTEAVDPVSKDVDALPIDEIVADELRCSTRGCARDGITCSPESDMRELTDVLVELNVGPEVVAGLTYGNLMVGVQANSDKLRDRGTRIVSAITDLGHDDSLRLLRRAAGGSIRRAFGED